MRARSSRWRCRSRPPPPWTRSRRRPASRSTRSSAMPRISKRRVAGSPRATGGKLVGTRLLASNAALGAAEEVADSGHGLDHVPRLAVRPKLATKTAHVELHEVSADVGVVPPDAFEDFLLREDAAGVGHEMP